MVLHFKRRLLEEGVREEDFIEVALDKKSDVMYRNPNLLYDKGRSFFSNRAKSLKIYFAYTETLPIDYSSGMLFSCCNLNIIF